MLRKTLIISTLMALLAAGIVYADSSAGNVHPNIRLSVSERFRFVSWDNTITLGDYSAASAFTRHRTSVTGQWFPVEQFEFGLKLTNEFRHYFVPQTVEFTMDEVFFDQLYIKARHGRATLTLGRQNVMLGEGFVVFDGGPLDGSRSAYFNAARLDVKPCPKGVVSLFYFYQPTIDENLPIIHDQKRLMVEQDEMGFGAYLSRDIEKGNLQAYYIRKNGKASDFRPTESRINTAGARLTYPIGNQWQLTAEGAYQFGTYDRYDQAAFGGYGYVDYSTGWDWYLPTGLTAGGIYLSGEDVGTDDREGWDPLFARWPKWSESYIYTLLRENGIAYWSNLSSIYGQARFAFTDEVAFSFQYYHLMAPQKSQLSWEWQTGEGTTRGELLIGKLGFTVNRYLNGHVLWEHFRPGDFYRERSPNADWLRIEFMLSVD